ncbi:hypothetical protein SO802_016123 [Lithocarpus litseifolius]|uniref:Uncharacterized protein n=1 Tax=Lithocarpus litseifolius TaxID=425828 RepID=A0AAW2CXU2_9ROSI
MENLSEWDRVVVEDVDSEEGSDERDGNGMVEFARIDSDCSELLNVTPLAISNSIGIHVDENLSGLLEDDQSGNQARLSPWFQSKYQELGSFLGTSIEGLEDLASNFLWAVEEKSRQRAA